MHRSALVLCLFVALAASTFVVQTEAARPDVAGSSAAVEQIRPDETERSARQGDRRISLDTGAPLALYRLSHRVSPGKPEAMAAQYLRESAAALHLASPELSDLEHRFTCDGLIDCNDPECSGDPACQCADIGEPCRDHVDCCSGTCLRGNPSSRVCVP